jgi:hypothetical protein
LTREIDDAQIAFSAIGEVSKKGIDGSYWIGETRFNSSGGIINISNFNKETLSYTLIYEGEVNKNNCPSKISPNTVDSKFISTISGSCDNPSAIFDSRVLIGKFNVTINCFG